MAPEISETDLRKNTFGFPQPILIKNRGLWWLRNLAPLPQPPRRADRAAAGAELVEVGKIIIWKMISPDSMQLHCRLDCFASKSIASAAEVSHKTQRVVIPNQDPHRVTGNPATRKRTVTPHGKQITLQTE